MRAKLVCSSCKSEFPITEKIWRCPNCGEYLKISYTVEDIQLTKSMLKERTLSMWRYRELLPVLSNDIITLGEGITPLINFEDSSFPNLKFKLDYINPTGSFKDRGASLSVTRLKAIGVNEIIEETSGNAGSALAAYSAKAGIKCTIYTPAYASVEKIVQMKIFGARVIKVKGSRQNVSKEALKAAAKVFFASHLWDPFFIHGLKTIAYEIAEQNKWEIPDYVVVPVGSGGLLLGIYHGFKDLYDLGFVNDIPRIIGVQSEKIDPVVKSLKEKKIITFKKNVKTIAEGIAVAAPVRIRDIIDAIQKTNGTAISIEEDKIIDALIKLARRGLFVEPTSATIYVAIKKMLDMGMIDRHDTIVGILTGSGLKATNSLIKIAQNNNLCD